MLIDPFIPAIVGIVLVGLYLYRADFQRYSIGTVGVFKRFEQSAVTGGDMDSVDMQCIECEKELVTAERRRYWEEVVVGGAVVLKRDVGESYYCEDHVSFEQRNELSDATHIYAERLPVGLIEGLARFTAKTPDMSPDEDSAFGSTVDDSVSLGLATILPAILLVLCLIPILKVIELYGKPMVE